MPIVILVVLLLFSTASVASILDDLPLIGGDQSFRVILSDNVALAVDLRQQLERERSGNADLRLLKAPEAIARFEANLLSGLLRAKGYYAAQVTWEIGKTRDYHVAPGPLYILTEVTFDVPSVTPSLDTSGLGITAGMPLDAKLVLAAQARIDAHYQQYSCFYRIEVRYDARVDHSRHAASLHFTLAPSEPAHFGAVRFSGAPAVSDEHLVNYLTFASHGCFSRKPLEQTRLELLQSGLLVSVTVETAPPQGGLSDIEFKLVERRPRTIKGGLSYDGDAGEGVALGWENRNLFGRGEKLALQGEFSGLTTKADSQITLPHFLAKAQNLVLHATLERESPAAYTARKGDFGVALNRRIAPYLVVGLGADALFTQVEQEGEPVDYGLVGLPFSVDINRRDDLLDPRHGWNLGAKTEAFWNVRQLGSKFQKSSLAASVYRSADSWLYSPTLALRASLGSIAGENLNAIPASERFYVGGGGSVRGYAYQSLGALTDNKADGGLSFGETSAELRLRLSGDWGAVLFVDGGWAYAQQLPSWGDGFLWGAGVGVRYYTSFAPIRFDIATPINRREGLDDTVQLYISIGQAF